MGVDARIEHSTRLSRCIAFVAKPPASAQKLMLHVVGDPVIQLGEWTRNEWSEALGHEIESLIQEHHDDAEQSDSKFAASYLDDTGRTIRTKTFTARTRPTRAIDGDEAGALAAMLDGTNQAQNTLIQQTGLALVRTFLAANQTLLQTLVVNNQSLNERVREAEARVEKAREEYLHLRDILTEMQSDKEPEELTPAQAKFFELANQSLPMIVAKLGAK